MKTLSVGTIGTATRDLKSMAGTIKKGTKVEIIAIGNRGYDVIAENGFRIIETGFDSVKVNEG